jgi:hypothetical protein
VLFGVLLEDRSLPSQCPVVARLAHSLEGAGIAGRLVITFAVMLIALARLVGHLPGDCGKSVSFRGEGHRLSYIVRLSFLNRLHQGFQTSSSPQLHCSSEANVLLSYQHPCHVIASAALFVSVNHLRRV